MASSLSLRSFGRFGSQASILGFTSVGSSLSIRSFIRLSSSVSLTGLIRAGSSIMRISVVDFLRMGSSMSVRSFSRAGSSISVLSYASLGSTVSIRGFSRLGSALSTFDTLTLGSSMSIRRFSRMGCDGCSIFDYMALGSSISIRSFTRLSSSLSVAGPTILAGNLALQDTKKLLFDGSGGDDYIVGLAPGGTEFYSSGAKKMVLGATSYLHGAWTAVSATLSSDARLKNDIVPLYKTLAAFQKGAKSKKVDVNKEIADTLQATPMIQSSLYDTTMAAFNETCPNCLLKSDNSTQVALEMEQAALLFNELRPVSYFMKQENNLEAKNLRFGFIAQEIENILPSLVRTDEEKDGEKSLLYSDIIAILTMTLQHEMTVTEKLSLAVVDHEERTSALEHSASREERISSLEQEIIKLKIQLNTSSLNDSLVDDKNLPVIEETLKKPRDEPPTVYA
jgi:hypothetical protein